MKKILKNGNIFVERDHFVSALCIEDGFITHVGSNEDATKWIGGEVIDLMGKTVVPGFNDSHMHLLSCGLFLQKADLNNANSIVDVVKICKEFLAKHPDTKILYGRGWNQDYFTDEKRLLTRWDLDKITTNIPVFVTRTCGHVASVNSKMIEILHLDKSFDVASGGELGFDGDVCNGILYEKLVSQIEGLIGESLTGQDICKVLCEIAATANACGITSVSSNDMPIGSPGGDAIEEGFLLYEKSNPTLRINHQISFLDLETFNKRIEEGYNKSTNPSFNRYGPIKLFIDGSLGARTALMRMPYNDDPSTNGSEVLTQEEINSFVKMASENGIQCVTHGIGNLGIDNILNAYETVNTDGENPLRNGIIHVQITDIGQLHRMAKNKILSIVQPIFLHYDMHIVEDRVGKELASTSYAFKTMKDLGLNTSYGSDSPVESFNVINCIHCAVNRQDLKFYPDGGFYPDEKVSIVDAIEAYTAKSAYTSFEENIKGKLLPGYYGDLVVLSDNIFTIESKNITDIKVDMTMVNGNVVYKR